MSNNIVVDCMVQQSSGGPQMLVLAVSEAKFGKPSIARCAWFDGGRLDSANITIDQLTLIPLETGPNSHFDASAIT